MTLGGVESDADEPALATGPDGDLASAGESTPDGLGITPTPDDGKRLTDTPPWDESTRPHRKPAEGDVTYTERGRMVGRHLIEVHDMLRTELGELRDLVAKVRQGALTAGAARSSLNDMALRQNNWTLGAFCSRYCNIVGQHHGAEDFAVFPHLVSSDPDLGQVIQRLTDEHLTIHDTIQKVDSALVEHINHPEDFDALQTAIDFLADTLLSHLSYEEHEIIEPAHRVTASTRARWTCRDRRRSSLRILCATAAARRHSCALFHRGAGSLVEDRGVSHLHFLPRGRCKWTQRFLRSCLYA